MCGAVYVSAYRIKPGAPQRLRGSSVGSATQKEEEEKETLSCFAQNNVLVFSYSVSHCSPRAYYTIGLI